MNSKPGMRSRILMRRVQKLQEENDNLQAELDDLRSEFQELTRITSERGELIEELRAKLPQVEPPPENPGIVTPQSDGKIVCWDGQWGYISVDDDNGGEQLLPFSALHLAPGFKGEPQPSERVRLWLTESLEVLTVSRLADVEKDPLR